MIVVDRGNNRLQLLGFNGQAFTTFRPLPGLQRPDRAWAYGSDRILIADTENNEVKELIPDDGAYVIKEHQAQPRPFSAPRGVAARS